MDTSKLKKYAIIYIIVVAILFIIALYIGIRYALPIFLRNYGVAL